MYAEITTAITSIKTVAEFVALAAKSKKDRDVAQKAAELNTVILDLQATIFSVQAQNQDLLRRNHELEQEIVEIENWKATAEQYTLTEIAPGGIFGYANKKDNDRVSRRTIFVPNAMKTKRSLYFKELAKGKGGYIFALDAELRYFSDIITYLQRRLTMA